MFKKSIVIILGLTIIVSGITGCGANKKQAGRSAANEITVSVFDSGGVSTSEGTMAENRWTKWVNENSGVNVKWVPISRTEFQQKMNALLASDSAPDLIVEYDRSYIAALVNQGVLATVNEYVDKYSTTYKKYLEENQELVPYTKYNDQMYALTSKRPTDAIANRGMWIRQDWLDKLGLKAPKTDEELFNVAKAFTEQDPDGNGKNDTYGIAMAEWEEAFPGFYFANAVWYNENGKPKFGSTVDRYKDSIVLMRRLYEAKAIDQEFFTDKTRASQRQLWQSGKAGMFIDYWTPGFNRELLTNVPNAKPVPLASVSTKYGTNGLWQELLPNQYVVFNKNIKNPEAAVKFIDWMIDSGWYTLSNGFENVHYRKNDNVAQVIDAEKNKVELQYAAPYVILSQRVSQPQMYQLMAPPDMISQELAKQQTLGLQTAMSNKFRRDFPYDPTMAEVTNVVSEFWPKRDEIRINVVATGKISPEEGYQQIVAAWKEMGGDKAEEKAYEFYKNNGLIN